MKKEKYIVKGTPVVPSVCAIGMAVLWYLYFYFSQGEWSLQMTSLSFAEMSGMEIYLTVLELAIPVLFFVGVLFLAEYSLRWMVLAMLPAVVQQVSLFVFYFLQDNSEYIFQNPIHFAAPFLALILFVLTVERVIPTKWVFVGFCGVAILLPLILTFCRIGEFTFTQQSYDANYQLVDVTAYFWSDYLAFALYYLGLGALAVQMRFPRESDLVTMADLKQAYEEKMAAKAAAEAAAVAPAEAVEESPAEEPAPAEASEAPEKSAPEETV